MIKSVNPINFKGTNLVANVKEQQTQEAPVAVEQPQASGSEAMANYNKAAIHPSQQIKPQVQEAPVTETNKETTPADVKENEKDDDKKEEKDD